MSLSQRKRMVHRAFKVLSFVAMLSIPVLVYAQPIADQLTSFWQVGGQQFDAASSVAVAEEIGRAHV